MRPRAWLTTLDADRRGFDSFRESRMVGCSCQCCERCWLYIDGENKPIATPSGVYVKCLYGGPYNGWDEVEKEEAVQAAGGQPTASSKGPIDETSQY